jgi:aryl-alcohol dehydrogenase-like predicted oxidoreductase
MHHHNLSPLSVSRGQATRFTASTPETRSRRSWEAPHNVVKAGKARYIGASSMFAWQISFSDCERESTINNVPSRSLL